MSNTSKAPKLGNDPKRCPWNIDAELLKRIELIARIKGQRQAAMVEALLVKFSEQWEASADADQLAAVRAIMRAG